MSGPGEYLLDQLKEAANKQPLAQGTKYDSDKLRYDLLPAAALEEVVKVYTLGAKKYDDRNWEKGINYGRVFGALMRHAWAWWRGERNATDDGQHHLASVVWCALALLHYDLNEKYKQFDNRPVYPVKNVYQEGNYEQVTGKQPPMDWTTTIK